MKKKFYCVIDTETIVEGQKVFDVGIRIINNSGDTVAGGSWLLLENFNKKLFFEEKRTFYNTCISKGFSKLVSIEEFFIEFSEFLEIAKECYGIEKLYAYNCSFDRRVLKNLSFEHYKYDIFKDWRWIDLWGMFAILVGTRKHYKQYCISNKLFTKNGNIKTSAESAFAYITRNKNFQEEHTAYADTWIEGKILLYLKKKWQKNKIVIQELKMPWIVAQEKIKIERYNNKKWLEIWLQYN